MLLIIRLHHRPLENFLLAMLETFADLLRTSHRFLFFFCFGPLAYLLFSWRRKQSRKGTPLPGPRGYPLLGNATQLGSLPWIQMEKWSKEYGTFNTCNTFRICRRMTIDTCKAPSSNSTWLGSLRSFSTTIALPQIFSTGVLPYIPIDPG